MKNIFSMALLFTKAGFSSPMPVHKHDFQRSELENLFKDKKVIQKIEELAGKEGLVQSIIVIPDGYRILLNNNRSFIAKPIWSTSDPEDLRPKLQSFEIIENVSE